MATVAQEQAHLGKGHAHLGQGHAHLGLGRAHKETGLWSQNYGSSLRIEPERPQTVSSNSN